MRETEFPADKLVAASADRSTALRESGGSKIRSVGGDGVAFAPFAGDVRGRRGASLGSRHLFRVRSLPDVRGRLPDSLAGPSAGSPSVKLG